MANTKTTQEYVEVLSSGSSASEVTQEYVEVLSSAEDPHSRVTQDYTEVLSSRTEGTHVASRQMPTLSLQVAFNAPGGTTLIFDDESRGLLDTATLAEGIEWTDVSSWFRGGTLQRGSSRASPVTTYDAGTLSVTLKNADRRFDPTNLSGPYVAAGETQVEPMRPVRYQATWAGVTYDLWRGFADNWDVSYSLRGNYSEVVLTASDGFKVLTNTVRTAVTPVGAGEDSGVRVSRILNSAGWPNDMRVISNGDTTLQATDLSGDALSELQHVAETEMGELYIDGAGRVVFRNRHALLTDDRSATSQATFGDAGYPELQYADVGVGNDAEQLVNEAHISRDGGTTQTAVDYVSKSKYLTHVYENTGLLMDSDSAAAGYANSLVFQNKDPELRFSEITIYPQRDPDELFPQVLARQIGDRITVKMRPDSGDAISREVFIRGITHEIGITSWKTTWTLQSASKYAFLTLDSSTLGQLDEEPLAF